MVEDARECGKAFFKRGDNFYAILMFQHAFLISRLIPFFPKDQSSLLHSNIALCCLKSVSSQDVEMFLFIFGKFYVFESVILITIS